MRLNNQVTNYVSYSETYQCNVIENKICSINILVLEVFLSIILLFPNRLIPTDNILYTLSVIGAAIHFVHV